MVEMRTGTCVKYRKPCRIIMKLEISRQDFEKHSVSNFMKILPVGAEFFVRNGRTDGRTNR